ncbi:MAG: AAA family ATPase [Sedimentisphaerales bacterium]|nr:AAA family ATPase [Sedimentisphaerales bacterium]
MPPQERMNDFERFEQLIQSGAYCISIVTYEERYALEIVRKTAAKLKRDMWVWSVADGVRDGAIDGGPCIVGTDTPAGGLTNLSQARPGSLCVTLDLAEHLRGGKALRVLRELVDNFHKTGIAIIMIDCNECLPDVIKAYARSFELSYPDEQELQQLIRATLQRLHRKKPIEVGITQRGLDTIVRNLRGLTRRQAVRIITDAVGADQSFNDDDINVVIANKRRIIQQGGLLEYIQTPLDLSEIGGMSRLKKWLNDRRDVFSPEARAFGIVPPKGVLMLGVQGAGKSLCAKAIATGWQQPLLRLDPSTLYASFIGESERNLREALRQTEMMAPVILWIDEIEKAFASAASRSADGGLSQRMFGTLLTWLQEHQGPVFVVATANDIEALPPELLRKGRFDEIFFVDLPTKEVRKEIYAIHLRKRGRDPAAFDLDALSHATEGFSGSEIEQAVIAALHAAYADKTQLDADRVIAAARCSPPLSATMAERVIALREWAKGRCMPAD